MLWRILVQFLFRASFGLAFSMAVTSPREVASGFYRVHSWVLLGISTFLCMVVMITRTEFEHANLLLFGSALAAFLSYAAAIVWLYERSKFGISLLAFISIINLYFGWKACVGTSPHSVLVAFLDVLSSGLVIGITLTAMLLGHWYLNTPTMKLAPLRRLIVGIGIAVLARAMFCGLGDVKALTTDQELSYFFIGALALRWLSGLFGLLGLAVLTWQTLKIPNTQSATGILYVGVIFVFIGELASQLLSIGSEFPY